MVISIRPSIHLLFLVFILSFHVSQVELHDFLLLIAPLIEMLPFLHRVCNTAAGTRFPAIINYLGLQCYL